MIFVGLRSVLCRFGQWDWGITLWTFLHRSRSSSARTAWRCWRTSKPSKWSPCWVRWGERWTSGSESASSLSLNFWIWCSTSASTSPREKRWRNSWINRARDKQGSDWPIGATWPIAQWSVLLWKSAYVKLNNHWISIATLPFNFIVDLAKLGLTSSASDKVGGTPIQYEIILRRVRCFEISEETTFSLEFVYFYTH